MERRNVLVKAVLCVASGFSEAFGEGITGNFQLCDLKGLTSMSLKSKFHLGPNKTKPNPNPKGGSPFVPSSCLNSSLSLFLSTLSALSLQKGPLSLDFYISRA